jgi:hypothetical protein
MRLNGVEVKVLVAKYRHAMAARFAGYLMLGRCSAHIRARLLLGAIRIAQ